MPARFTVLDRLPLSANGKVDRAALAEQAAGAGTPTGAPPAGPAETALAALWRALLAAPVTDRNANFFTLGGDSLLALRLVGTIQQRYGVEVPVRQFLATPTVAALAGHLDAAGATQDAETGVKYRRHPPDKSGESFRFLLNW